MIKFMSLILILFVVNVANAEELSANAEATVEGNGVVIAVTNYDNSLFGGYVESIAYSEATIGTLTSTAYASGRYTGGYGEVINNGEASNDYTTITTGISENGLSFTQVYTQHTILDTFNTITGAFSWAWASNEDPFPKIVMPIEPTGGYFEVYGKSDAERYYYNRYLRDTHCADINTSLFYTNKTEFKILFNSSSEYYMCSMALYRIDEKLNTYHDTPEQFEYKYNLSEVIRLNPNFVKRNGHETYRANATMNVSED